ncbi:hypothetical protein BC826DRAFT_1025265, partial [Russula brevipes]
VIMHFRSTLVITFLVPILDILASVGAAPSGFQSRDGTESFPFLLDFLSPSPGQFYNGQQTFRIVPQVNLYRLVTDQFHPPWAVDFSLVHASKSTYIGTVNITILPDGFLEEFIVQLSGDVLGSPVTLAYGYVVDGIEWRSSSGSFTLF